MKKLTTVSACCALIGSIVLGGAVSANAHGLIGNGLRGGDGVSDVTARQAMPNADLGSVQWDTQSIEGPKGFSLDPATGGPADGQLPSGGNASFSNLNAQSPDRWVENQVTAGQTLDISWYYTAPHKTSQWRYYITKRDWDQNAPLTRAQLEPLRTVTWDGSAAALRANANGDVHQVDLPPGHTGDHVIFAVWDVADTANAFYNAIDIHIAGSAQPEEPDTVAPSAPTRVESALVTHDSAQISWEASTDNVGVDRYEIRRAAAGGDFERAGTTANTSFTDSRLLANTQYSYQIVAVDGSGNASGAGTVTVTTRDVPLLPVVDTESPTVPMHLHAMETTSGSIDLMWTESQDNVGIDRYDVQRAAAGGTFYTVGSTRGTSHLDAGLESSTTYDYRVIAYDAAGNASAPSEAFTVTTETGSPVDPSVEQWSATRFYLKGAHISHDGAIYEAVQSYQGYGDANWIAAPSLWRKIG